jgi:hypothetical protein
LQVYSLDLARPIPWCRHDLDQGLEPSLAQ